MHGRKRSPFCKTDDPSLEDYSKNPNVPRFGEWDRGTITKTPSKIWSTSFSVVPYAITAVALVSNAKTIAFRIIKAIIISCVVGASIICFNRSRIFISVDPV